VVYAAAVGFLALVALGSVVTARRTRRPAPAADPRPDEAPTAHPAIATESLARAAEVGLAEVGDTNREPRAAIIACYAAMESELALVPAAAPRDFDTASEVLARAVEYGALRYDSATQLVELFEEARFSPHVMSEAHRDTAALDRWLSRTEILVNRAGSTRREWDRHLRPMLARQFEMATGQHQARDRAAFAATGRMLFGPQLWVWVDPDGIAPAAGDEPGPGRAVLDEILARLERI
jgi:hypothetical protein